MIILMFLCFIVYATIAIRFIEWSIKYVTKPVNDYFDELNKTTELKITKKPIVEIIITHLTAGPNEDESNENKHKPYNNRLNRFNL